MKIKNILKMIASAFICAVFSFSAQAEGKRPFQAQFIVTGVGSGVNLGYHINDMFFVGADFAAISMSQEDKDDKGTVEVDGSFSTQILMLRVSPFEGVFFVQGGLVNRSWDLEGDGIAEIGNSGQAGRVKATVKFPSAALNLGIGWNWISDFGLSGGIGLGLITGGKPEADVEVDNPSGIGVTLNDVREEEKNLESEMERFATVPYGHLSIGYNF